MKKTVTLLCLVAATTIAKAQTTEKRIIQLSDFALDASNNASRKTIGLNYIVTKKNNWANRYGLTLNKSQVMYNPYYYYYNPNRSYATTNQINTTIKGSLGKEYRMPLTNKIYLYTGADLNINYQRFNTKTNYNMWDSVTSTNSTTQSNYGYGDLTLGISPFAGVRANVGRLALGVEAKSNFSVNYSNYFIKTLSVKTTAPSIGFNIGYRIFK